MNRISTTVSGAIAIAVFMSTTASHADTAFTYQAELKQNGDLANGSFNMDFALWDALNGGNQIGPTVMIDGVQVTDGRFTVELDFGVASFDNSDRWLEIEVSGETLVPRPFIARSPYSINSLQTRGLSVDVNERVGIGIPFPESRLHVVGPGTSPVMRVSGGGSSNTAILVDDVVGGGRAAAFQGVSTNDMLSVVNLGNGNAAAFIGRVQISDGGDAVGSTLTVNSSGGPVSAIEATAQNDPDTNSAGRFINLGAGPGTEYGMQAFANSPGGYGAFTSGGQVGIDANASGPTGIGVYGGAGHLSGVNYAVYGQSNSPNGFDFFAGGAGANYGAPSSQRWKHDIQPLPNALATIAQLRGVSFTWDAAHGGQHDIGMIAEEVGEIMPEVVQYEENGVDAIGMDYSKLTPLLVEAVNALRAEKDAEIAELNAAHDQQIESLETRIRRLETLMIHANSSQQESES